MIHSPANGKGAAGIAGGVAVSAEKCDTLLRVALAARRHRPASYPALRAEYLNAARSRRAAFRNASTTAHAANARHVPGRIHGPIGQSRMRIIRNNTVIGSTGNSVIHTVSASAARHRAALASAQAKLTGWTRDLYRAVTVYARSIERAAERAAHGLTDGVCRDDNVSYRRVRHAPVSAVNDIHSGSTGLATSPDSMASRIAVPATVRAKHGLARVADPRASMGDGRYHVSVPVIDPEHAARRLTKRERSKLKR